jgi:hypothetical protein
MKETGKINYIEMPSRDLEATKRFFADAFGWSFRIFSLFLVVVVSTSLTRMAMNMPSGQSHVPDQGHNHHEPAQARRF